MKKITLIGIVIVVLIAYLAASANTLFLVSGNIIEMIVEFRESRRDKLMTEEMMLEVFDENREMFSNVAVEMIKIDYRWRLSKPRHSEDRIDAKDGLAFDYTEDNIRVFINDDTKTHEIVPLKSLVEKNKNISKIINEFSFEGIDYSFYKVDCIEFYDADSIDTAGLIYCPAGEPESMHFIKLVKLDDYWYYFEMD